MRYHGILHNAAQGHEVLLRAWEAAKPFLLAGHRLEVVIKPQTRSLDQNAKFHALCSDIANSGLQWAGKRRNAAAWKVLLVSGHATATKEGSDMIPGLEGEFVNIRESTALMSKKRGASLIEYTLAFGTLHGVSFSEPEVMP